MYLISFAFRIIAVEGSTLRDKYKWKKISIKINVSLIIET